MASRHCSARSPFQSMFILGVDDDDADEEADDAEPRKDGRLAAAAGLGLAAAAAAAAGGWLPLEAGRATSLSSAGSSWRRSRDSRNVVHTSKNIRACKT